MSSNNTFFTGKNCGTFSQAVSLLVKENPIKKIVRMHQTHSSNIAQVDKINEKKHITTLKNTDGCFTTLNNTALSIKTADCLPILISYKPLSLIAAVHAGRKGTQSEIILNLLNKMNKKLDLVNTIEKNAIPLEITFNPAICVDCYQIDRKTDAHFDLISENKQQIFSFFEEHELQKEKIRFSISTQCTLHNNENLYSYRKSGPGVKMNYSFIWNISDNLKSS